MGPALVTRPSGCGRPWGCRGGPRGPAGVTWGALARRPGTAALSGRRWPGTGRGVLSPTGPRGRGPALTQGARRARLWRATGPATAAPPRGLVAAGRRAPPSLVTPPPAHRLEPRRPRHGPPRRPPAPDLRPRPRRVGEDGAPGGRGYPPPDAGRAPGGHPAGRAPPRDHRPPLTRGPTPSDHQSCPGATPPRRTTRGDAAWSAVDGGAAPGGSRTPGLRRRWGRTGCHPVGVGPPARGRRPRRRAVRQRCAGPRLRRWSRAGREVQGVWPHRAVRARGHGRPRARSWSLPATPARLEAAAARGRGDAAEPRTSRRACLAPHGPTCGPAARCQHPPASPPPLARDRDPLRLCCPVGTATTGRAPRGPPGERPRRAAGAAMARRPGVPTRPSGPRAHHARGRPPAVAPVPGGARPRAPRAHHAGAGPPAQPGGPAAQGGARRGAVEALLAAPERSCGLGRRAHARRLTLSHRGARGSEVIPGPRHQVGFGTPTGLPRTGTGRTARPVPRWPHTSRTLQAWCAEVGEDGGRTALPHRRGRPRSRDGVAPRRPPATPQAVRGGPRRHPQQVTPPVLRPPTALHWRQAGVDRAVIALWLGPARLATPPVARAIAWAPTAPARHPRAPVEGPMARFPPPIPGWPA